MFFSAEMFQRLRFHNIDACIDDRVVDRFFDDPFEYAVALVKNAKGELYLVMTADDGDGGAV